MVEIEFTSHLPLDEAVEPRLVEAVRRVLLEASVHSAEISLAVVNDATIHKLNRRHLDHDYPTDVLSFCLRETPDPCDASSPLEGEIIVSWERACDVAPQFHWSPENELLLYVIHGALHLVGHDDHEPSDLERMRQAENRHLLSFGLTTRDRSSVGPAVPTSSPSSMTALSRSSLSPSDNRGGS
jgi:probable rRNA maturation factor